MCGLRPWPNSAEDSVEPEVLGMKCCGCGEGADRQIRKALRVRRPSRREKGRNAALFRSPIAQRAAVLRFRDKGATQNRLPSGHFDTPSTISVSIVFIAPVLSFDLLDVAAMLKPSLRRRRTEVVPLISP